MELYRNKKLSREEFENAIDDIAEEIREEEEYAIDEEDLENEETTEESEEETACDCCR